MTRANWLPAPHYFKLNQGCVAINQALGDYGCYLVGSCMERRDYRDVDVRYIMADAKYDQLFGKNGGNKAINSMWTLMVITISEWLSTQTNLQVDFQIQKQTEANEEFKGRPRSALGIFIRPDEVA